MTKSKQIALISGPALFLILQIMGKPESLSTDAFHVFTVTIWMAVWWISEALPIAVTSLLPIILFPLTGVLDLSSVTSSYGHKYIFLYMGGFMIAIAIEKWNLHRRIALNVINFIGEDLNKIILGFMLATAFLSMWISNTATSVMMLPIGLAIISQFDDSTEERKKSKNQFAKALMISIAYSASIGGFATLIGTPPNLVLAGILEEMYQVKISFTQWLVFGLPLSALLFAISWKYLTSFSFNFKNMTFPGGKTYLKDMLVKMGKISYEERAVLFVFVLTALAWMSRSLLQKWVPFLDDTIIAMIGGMFLFIIPNKEKTAPIITWEDAVKLPWGIILLFGGGIAIAKGFTETGLAEWIALQMSSLNGITLILLILLLVAMVNFLTEITSNLATTAMLLPILAPMALAFNIHPFMIMVSVTIAASCAFMLPVATPPNAVVFGSGMLKIKDMIRTGFAMNIISILLITLISYFMLPLLWDFDPTTFPSTFKTFLQEVVSPLSFL